MEMCSECWLIGPCDCDPDSPRLPVEPVTETPVVKPVAHRPAPPRPMKNPAVKVCDYLLAHLEWLTSQLFSDEVVREIVNAVNTLEHKWPRDMEKQKQAMPCPHCNSLTVTIHPTPGFRVERLIQCEYIGCGRRITEEEWEKARSTMPTEIRVGDMLVEVTRGRAS